MWAKAHLPTIQAQGLPSYGERRRCPAERLHVQGSSPEDGSTPGTAPRRGGCPSCPPTPPGGPGKLGGSLSLVPARHAGHRDGPRRPSPHPAHLQAQGVPSHGEQRRYPCWAAPRPGQRPRGWRHSGHSSTPGPFPSCPQPRRTAPEIRESRPEPVGGPKVFPYFFPLAGIQSCTA